MMRRAIVLAAAGVIAASALAGSAGAATVGVSVGNYYFEDASVGDGRVTAQVGDQLRFTVVEGAGHTVTVDALGIDSGQLPIGATFVTPALGTPGNYTLYCRSHVNRNHVTTLVVLGAPATTAPPTTRPPSTVAPTTTVAGGTTVPGVTTPGATTPSGGGTDQAGTTPDGSSSGPVVTGSPGDSTPPATDASGELLPAGVTTPDSTPWLRSVWVALVALVVLTGVVLAAIRAGERHHREAYRID